MRRFVRAALLLLLAASCSFKNSPLREAQAEARRAEAKEKAARREAMEKAESLAERMDDRLLAAQVLMTAVDGARSVSAETAALLSEIPVGALMLFRYNLSGGAEGIRTFIAGCSAAVVAAPAVAAEPAGAAAPAGEEGAADGGGMRVLPFVALDHEGGAVHRLGSDATRLPSHAAFARAAENRGVEETLRAVEQAAELSGKELRSLGFSMNLAPVAEVLDGENDAFLDTRSFGADADFAGAASAAFVRGMAAAGVASAVKHFPGNGAADPHHEQVLLDWGKERLEAALEPFRTVLSGSEPGAVMVSHAVVAAVDPSLPGSLSPALMTGILKERLGFRGIVLSDDFRMAAVASTGRTAEQAAAEALGAGADMIMTWQRDLRRLHAALLAAVERGELSRSRLRDAASRVLYAKIRSGLLRDDGSPSPRGGMEDLETLKRETEGYLRERGLR